MAMPAGFSEFIAAADLRRWLTPFSFALLACIALYTVRMPPRAAAPATDPRPAPPQ